MAIAPVNDNPPVLLLDGTNSQQDFSTTFAEGQAYLGGAVPVRLSSNLTVQDGDVGPQYLIDARVEITDGKLYRVKLLKTVQGYKHSFVYGLSM